jgi:hypothetical protein
MLRDDFWERINRVIRGFVVVDFRNFANATKKEDWAMG